MTSITIQGRAYRLRDSIPVGILPHYRIAPAAFLAAILADPDSLPTLSLIDLMDAAESAFYDILIAP
jgi:hypothetical protein